jgi:hypothetical protein
MTEVPSVISLEFSIYGNLSGESRPEPSRERDRRFTGILESRFSRPSPEIRTGSTVYPWTVAPTRFIL